MSLARRLRAALLALVAASYAYVAFEWLYQVTKPSFMSSFDALGTLTSLVVPPLLLIALGAPLATVLSVIEVLPRAGRVRWGLLPSATLLAALGFLLFDNFTYTLFRFGVISTGRARWCYLALFAGLVFLAYRMLASIAARLEATGRRTILAVAALGGLSLAGVIADLATADRSLADVEVKAAPGRVIGRPNVVVISTDATEARWLSTYGYPIPTTPFLDRLAGESVLFENAFSNAGKTTGSTLSMLTGRPPDVVKVGFPPHVLRREDAFRHLPAMLRKLGYRELQSTVRYYADAGSLNMLGGFDVANARDLSPVVPGTPAASLALAFDREVLLLAEMRDRLVSRLLHAAGVRDMVNPFFMVQFHEGAGFAQDRAAVDGAIEFARRARGPFFLHLHLMGTHPGPATGRSRTAITRADLQRYPGALAAFAGPIPELLAKLNAIHDFDENLERLVTGLREAGSFDDTLLVVTSDHDSAWDTDDREPLVIRFPGGRRTGRVSTNVQLLDVPATILDELGVAVPPWMTSRPLMADAPERPECDGALAANGRCPILSLAKFNEQWLDLGVGEGMAWAGDSGPPRYGVERVGVVVCSRYYSVALANGAVNSHDVFGHTRPCPAAELPAPEQVRRWVKERLQKEGFRLPF